MSHLTTLQIARFIISFSWFYHGLFPKLVHISPLEQQMTGSFGFNPEISNLITRAAGVGEIIFAVLFFYFLSLYFNQCIKHIGANWLNVICCHFTALAFN